MTNFDVIAHAIKGSDGSRYCCLGFEEALRKAQELSEAFPRVQFSVVELIERPTHEPGGNKCWQPIETAPKDGSFILAYFDYNPIYRDSSEKWFCTVVRWSGEYSMWSMPGISGLSPKLWQPITYPNGVVSANGLKSL